MHGTTPIPEAPKTLGGREVSGTLDVKWSWENEDPWKTLRERELGRHQGI